VATLPVVTDPSSVMAGRLPMRVRTRASPGKTLPLPLRARASALGVICRALVALSLGAALATLAQAQPPAPTPLQAAPSQAAPSQAAPAAAPATALTQVVTLPAGTGMLLRLQQPASTVMSANPAVARVQPASPTSLFLMGVAAGRTTVLATAESGTAIVQYDVSVTPGETGAPPPSAAAAPPLILGGGPLSGGAATTATVTPAIAAKIQAAIATSVMGAASVRVQAIGGGLLVTGTVPTAVAAQTVEAISHAYAGDGVTLVDRLFVLSSIQVNVRVRIAEIDRNITRQLGFNWQALGTNGNWQYGVLTGAALAGKISPLSPLGLTALSGATSPPFQVGAGYSHGGTDINGIIDALAADQLVTILAEPNLTAQSGETASFLAGGEFPVPIAGSTSNGSATITVEFKQFGVSLAVIPTVLSPGRLNLRVRPEVSQLSTNGAVSVPIGNGATVTIPALTVRRAETTVELGSGQSFAIAGLLEKTSSDNTNALPGLGELPVIGALFKSNDFQRGVSELVIIVTPYLVKPAPSPDALHLPTDGFVPATDLDRILLGRQVAPGPDGAPLDAGFILK
jgi:pilus assembly protein CpaC